MIHRPQISFGGRRRRQSDRSLYNPRYAGASSLNRYTPGGVWLLVAGLVTACGTAQDVQLGGGSVGIDRETGGGAGAVGVGDDSGGGDDDSSANDGSGGTTSDMLTCTAQVVDVKRLVLLDDLKGFAEGTRGGAEGCEVIVKSSADSGPGTLREALESSQAAWIRFSVNNIDLTSDIRVQSNKTIDGRGGDVIIRNFGLRIGSGISNVIIHNTEFLGTLGSTGTGGGTGTEESDDAIEISGGARDIWIDHNNFSNYNDGLIDIIEGATNITVSYNHFFEHRRVMLIGKENGGLEDEGIRVTLHHNWYDKTETYHPRVRKGWVHSYNNYLMQWHTFGSGASEAGEIASEGNVYEAGADLNAIALELADDPDPGKLRSDGDVAINGAVLTERLPDEVFLPADFYEYSVETAGSSLIEKILSEVGPH